MRNEKLHQRLDEVCRQGHKYVWIVSDFPFHLLVAFTLGFLFGISVTRLVWG